MSYLDGVSYLNSKTRICELCNQFGGRVVICPEWGGRVMTSSCDGIDGYSFGLINVKEIDALHGKNYGGEDHLVLAAEDSFQVDSMPQESVLRMRHSIRKPSLELDIVRIVKLLHDNDILQVFGNDVAVSLEQTDVSYVAFATTNIIVSPSKSHVLSDEHITFHISSKFNSGQSSVAIIPFRPDSAVLGASIETEFFGTAPHGRLRILSETALLRTDGKYRCQVSVPRNRVVPILGAIDFREGFLTLTAFEMSSTTADDDEIAVQAYNHGQMESDEVDCAQYYEFDVFSPIRDLHKGESLTHHQYTLHLVADNKTLSYLVQKIFGVEYDKIYEKMMK